MSIRADLTELDLPSTMKMDFPDPADTLHFNLDITPDEGMYKGGKFHFSFTIRRVAVILTVTDSLIVQTTLTSRQR